jgi:hypothetical protein
MACTRKPGESPSRPLYGRIIGRPSGSADMSACWACSRGGGVRMSGIAGACGRYHPQVVRRMSGRRWRYLRRAASADFTCAISCLTRELGLRTTIRPTVALTLLHVDHPPAAQRWFGSRVRVSTYQSAEPSVSQVRSSTVACLEACNCALPGVRSQGRDRGARPAHRI